MKYFLDTEFHEYKKKPLFGKAIDTIELISIGIVDCNGREYYAISKEFDVKAAWDNKWLRENVLYPIFKEMHLKHYKISLRATHLLHDNIKKHFSYKNFKALLAIYGKTKERIAEEIKEFVYKSNHNIHPKTTLNFDQVIKENPIEFYAYYADYDWVVFCWLFGRMIDLPKGFPMYCKDLKQLLDEHFQVNKDLNEYIDSCLDTKTACTLEHLKKIFHEHLNHEELVPQSNEHNALADAHWNRLLYKELVKL